MQFNQAFSTVSEVIVCIINWTAVMTQICSSTNLKHLYDIVSHRGQYVERRCMIVLDRGTLSRLINDGELSAMSAKRASRKHGKYLIMFIMSKMYITRVFVRQ